MKKSGKFMKFFLIFIILFAVAGAVSGLYVSIGSLIEKIDKYSSLFISLH